MYFYDLFYITGQKNRCTWKSMRGANGLTKSLFLCVRLPDILTHKASNEASAEKYSGKCTGSLEWVRSLAGDNNESN